MLRPLKYFMFTQIINPKCFLNYGLIILHLLKYPSNIKSYGPIPKYLMFTWTVDTIYALR